MTQALRFDGAELQQTAQNSASQASAPPSPSDGRYASFCRLAIPAAALLFASDTLVVEGLC